MKKTVIIVTFFVLASLKLFAGGNHENPDSYQDSPTEREFPVKQVRLYTAGLAQIVHETQVDGDEEILFPVEQRDIDDILKSLVIEDIDGGIVEAVGFRADNPLSAALSDMRLNPAGNPALEDFLRSAQGESIRIQTGSKRIDGRIFSVEEKSLAIHTRSGLKNVSLDEIKNLEFSDERLRRELDEALALIAGSRIQTSRMLRISLRGKGHRRIRLSYVKAVPLWKTSYRMLIDDEGNASLEAWAIVQNTGAAAWEHVELSFIAGSPNAFMMDMSSPVYVPRQRKELQSNQPLAPSAYEDGWGGESSRAFAKSAAPMAESEAEMDYYRAEESYIARNSIEAAEGERMGNFYRYTLSRPVTIAPRSSAMVPIIHSRETGRTLGLYDPAYNTVFKAVYFENQGEQQWPAGPVSVIEGRGYGGDALLPETLPGGQGMLSYAVHGELKVHRESESAPSRIVSLRIVNGVLERSDILKKNTVYSFEGKERELIIIHPRQSGWELVSSPDILDRTNSQWRFTTDTSRSTTVEEQRIVSRSIGLLTLGSADLSVYLQWEDISPEIERLLQGVKKIRLEIEETKRKLNAQRSSISRIERDQNRIRENMKVLDQESALYIRYSETLNAQETELATLYRQSDELESSLNQLNAELEEMVSGANIS